MQQTDLSVHPEYGPYVFHSDYFGRAINRCVWELGRPRAFYFCEVNKGCTVTASSLSEIKCRIKEVLE